MRMGMYLQQRVELKQKLELTLQQKLELKIMLELRLLIKQILKQYFQEAIKSCAGQRVGLEVRNQIADHLLAHVRSDKTFQSQDAYKRLTSEISLYDKVDAWIGRYRGKVILPDGKVTAASEPAARARRIQEPVRPELKVENDRAPKKQRKERDYGLEMGMSLRIEQKMVVPYTNFSFLKAIESGDDFDDRVPTLELKRGKIEGYDDLSHEERMQRVDMGNEIFHYEYVAVKKEDGKSTGYYKIPLTRNYRINSDYTRIEITKEEYDFSRSVLKSAGGVERIARAIPYGKLHESVKTFLEEEKKETTDNAVIVGIDRGGRLPSLILSRALNHSSHTHLKVDQGGSLLDEDRIQEFIETKSLSGKHILFVDSTVDSGRQIRALRTVFDDPEYKAKLGFTGWSIVGSNENGYSHCAEHLDINWGVNPDETFEDDPRVMGVDYAPGSHTKVIEVPSATSEKIRRALVSVPDGYVYDLDDARRQFMHLKKPKTKQSVLDSVQAEVETITSSDQWSKLCAEVPQVEIGDKSDKSTESGQSKSNKILLIGNGKSTNIPELAAELIAAQLASKVVLSATLRGNPGQVMNLVRSKSASPKPVLYQVDKGHQDENTEDMEVRYCGGNKDHMRYTMVRKADRVVVLGGEDGTLKEVLLSIRNGKHVYLIEGWGAVSLWLKANMSGYSKWQDKIHFYPNITAMLKAVA